MCQIAERHIIDSLKKVLPLLHDSARVDCLNELSGTFLKLEKGPIEWKHMNIAVIAGSYAASAYTEAKKINYIHGIAESLSYKGEVESLSNNFPLLETFCREAIEWYRNTPNKKRLAETYYNLGFALYAQSMFTEAIKNLDTSYKLYEKNNNIREMLNANTTAVGVYEESGNYEKAFELARKGLNLAIENNEDWFRRTMLTIIGSLFGDIEDYRTALAYCFQAAQNLKADEYNSFNPRLLRVIAELYSQKQQFDSAKYYYGLFDTSNERGLRFYLVSFGEYNLLQKEYEKALPSFMRGLDYHRRSNDRNWVMRSLLDIAKTYLALGNNDSAFKYGDESLSIAKQTEAKQVIRDACKVLSSVYDHWHQPDSAFFYYQWYTTMKDSVLSDQVKGKLAAYHFEQKIELLSKEKEIQQAQLQKESLWRKLLIIGIIALIFIAVIIVRVIMLKRKNEKNLRELAENKLTIQKLASDKKQSDLQQQAIELEMQALRAQMNPHFIFNCLNAINGFILRNDSETAADYLTKFSRLIRMVLNNSQRKLISLEEDMETLGLYLYIEKLRFTNNFQYKINCDDGVDALSIFIPPMLLQPFAENAIWHGLMQKDGNGELLIELHREENILHCTITDNGIGRKKATSLKSKSAEKNKSLGLQITKKRMALLNQDLNDQNFFEIHDLKDERGNATGTRVSLKIKIKETPEENVSENLA